MARTIDKLSATIDKILKSRGMRSRLQEYRISGQWTRIVGPVISLHAQPLTLRGDKLALVVDNPAWMQQLSLMRPEIIGKLNDTLGARTVREITLRLGEIALPPMQLPGDEGAAPEITAEDRERIELYLHGIGDDEVRDAMRRLIEKDLLRRKREAGK